MGRAIVTDDQERMIAEMLMDDLSPSYIAREAGVSRSTVHDRRKRLKPYYKPKPTKTPGKYSRNMDSAPDFLATILKTMGGLGLTAIATDDELFGKTGGKLIEKILENKTLSLVAGGIIGLVKLYGSRIMTYLSTPGVSGTIDNISKIMTAFAPYFSPLLLIGGAILLFSRVGTYWKKYAPLLKEWIGKGLEWVRPFMSAIISLFTALKGYIEQVFDVLPEAGKAIKDFTDKSVDYVAKVDRELGFSSAFKQGLNALGVDTGDGKGDIKTFVGDRGQAMLECAQQLGGIQAAQEQPEAFRKCLQEKGFDI